jgi:predicted metal-dependent enzyme (double-stranded beta helix superfamily)
MSLPLTSSRPTLPTVAAITESRAPHALGQVVTALADRPDLWRHRIRFDATQRWSTRLHADEHLDVWLISWASDQAAELHDHGGSLGALYVVSGELTEDVVDGPARVVGPRIAARRLPAGTGRRFGPRHVHRIANRSRRPAVSLHVYGPALNTMNRYRLGPNGLERVAVERAGAQW